VLQLEKNARSTSTQLPIDKTSPKQQLEEQQQQQQQQQQTLKPLQQLPVPPPPNATGRITKS
jgi:hypothetical protein